ncbi:class I SAM-dependent methyltransferase [Anatilimnocola aggregata]|nr:class I SAM-dependent methyltransferase [Anatilimnocola aggregata]
MVVGGHSTFIGFAGYRDQIQPDTINGMGIYSRFVFPLLCDFALDNTVVNEQRRQLLSQVEGAILEIGFGTGLNLPHYPAQTRQITTVDPNEGMSKRAQRRIKGARITVEQHQQRSEMMPFGDGAFDCIVSTFTLCSIADVTQAIKEVFRVLKPEGKFLFLEHGISPEPNIERWQRRLNGIQQWFGDGCHLDRNMKQIISASPFSTVDSTEGYLEKMPKTHGYVYQGVARK